MRLSTLTSPSPSLGRASAASVGLARHLRARSAGRCTSAAPTAWSEVETMSVVGPTARQSTSHPTARSAVAQEG